jgi:hypothetical protein
VRTSLIWAFRSRPLKRCTLDSRPPPPPPLSLKVERQGGSRIALSIVDPGAPIKTIEEMHPRFRTPPPSIKGRKAGGLRNPMCVVDLGARISVAQICLPLNHKRPSSRIAPLRPGAKTTGPILGAIGISGFGISTMQETRGARSSKLQYPICRLDATCPSWIGRPRFALVHGASPC